MRNQVLREQALCFQRGRKENASISINTEGYTSIAITGGLLDGYGEAKNSKETER